MQMESKVRIGNNMRGKGREGNNNQGRKEARKAVPGGAEATLNVRFRLQQKKLATAGSETLVKPFSLSSTANAV